MRSPTDHYKNLRKGLTSIRSIMRGVPTTQCNTMLHHLKVQSYIFLSHAAFEEYIENISKMILDESVTDYNKNGKINGCIVSLIAFETIAQFDKNTPRKSISLDVVKNLSKFVNLASQYHKGAISKNNGIKMKDQKSILLPVGLDTEAVDVVTANSLDSFGVKRGGIAHSLKMQTSDTKSSVLSVTQTILIGLKTFDTEACNIIAT